MIDWPFSNIFSSDHITKEQHTNTLLRCIIYIRNIYTLNSIENENKLTDVDYYE